MKDIWNICNASAYISPLNCAAFRAVEGQSYIATRKLVNSDYEQFVLEKLLDNSKPSTLKNGYHYLLTTPFRYPPLQYGSRFGSKDRMGIFYGSIEIATTLAEVAYYRFIFMSDSDAKFEPAIIPYTSFKFQIASNRALDLTNEPFVNYKQDISNPQNYKTSQALGDKMRDGDITSCLFYSARCKGKNIAILNIAAFKGKNIHQMKNWDCYVDDSNVTFYHINKHYSYSREVFF